MSLILFLIFNYPIMSKVVLYIACSLDGYIAKPDGNVDWLNTFPNPDGTDYGYGEFRSSIDTAIMGRRTYEEILGYGVEWPYSGMVVYVVTADKRFKVRSPDTYTIQRNLREHVSGILSKTEKDVWLVGGGKLISLFLNQNLLDRMIITIVPIILGDGIPLFAENPRSSVWKLSNSKPYESGLISLTYDRKTYGG